MPRPRTEPTPLLKRKLEKLRQARLTIKGAMRGTKRLRDYAILMAALKQNAHDIKKLREVIRYRRVPKDDAKEIKKLLANGKLGGYNGS